MQERFGYLVPCLPVAALLVAVVAASCGADVRPTDARRAPVLSVAQRPAVGPDLVGPPGSTRVVWGPTADRPGASGRTGCAAAHGQGYG